MSEMMINQTIENTENIDQKALELAQDFSSNRMELRSPDCSCNIYLAYALLIYAGLEGIEKNMIPDPCTDVVSVDTKRLPQSLKEAKLIASNASWLKEILGNDIVDIYVG